jgi:hypothetical protein
MLTRSMTLLMGFLFATALQAQNVEIDDDGFSVVEPAAPNGVVVEMDDDGFTRGEAATSGDVAERRGTPGSCTQLERSAGIQEADCGTMTRAEITALQAD